jgi:hypothetical protein
MTYTPFRVPSSGPAPVLAALLWAAAAAGGSCAATAAAAFTIPDPQCRSTW